MEGSPEGPHRRPRLRVTVSRTNHGPVRVAADFQGVRVGLLGERGGHAGVQHLESLHNAHLDADRASLLFHDTLACLRDAKQCRTAVMPNTSRWTRLGYGSDDAGVRDLLAKLDAMKSGT